MSERHHEESGGGTMLYSPASGPAAGAAGGAALNDPCANLSLLRDGRFGDDESVYLTGGSSAAAPYLSRPLYSAGTVFAAFVAGVVAATALGAAVLAAVDGCDG